jgi:phage shock protein E
MVRSYLLLILIAVFFLSACSRAATQTQDGFGRQVQVPGGAYTDITVVELQDMLAEKDFTFINVHIPFEGDIAGTDLSIPYNQIDQNLDLLPGEKDAKIVLYCRSDRMSRIAAESLVGLGFSNIWNLEGGMLAWERAGQQLEWDSEN